MKKSSSFFYSSAKGVFWLGGGQIFGQVVHLFVRIVLARLLLPEDFGLIAMAMVVITFTERLYHMGFSAALVQRKDLTDAHLSTAFWSNVLIGIFAFICLALSAPFIAALFSAEKLSSVIIALSVSVILSSPTPTLAALFRRDFAFKALAVRRIGSMVAGGTVGVILALNGFGVWALVGESLARSFIGSVLLFWQSGWRPSFVFDREAFKDLWSFSKPLIVTRFITFFNRNLDTILVGKYLGVASLGFYNLGYQFVLLPLTYISRSTSRVLLSTFSKLQGEEVRLRDAYLKSTQLVTSITLPIMTLVALSAPTLIPGLLSDKWIPAIPIIPFMCTIGVVRSINGLVPTVFMAKGNTGSVLRWVSINTVGNTVAFVIGLRWGIIGVAIAYAISSIIMSIILLPSLFKVLGIGWTHFLKVLSHAFFQTAILVVLWYVFGMITSLFNIEPGLLKVSVQICVTTGIYLWSSWRWNPVWKDAVSRFASRRRQASQAS